MKKLFLFLVLALLATTPAFAAGFGVNNNGTQAGAATDMFYNCPANTQLVVGSQAYANCGNLLATGTANGGFSSLATIDAGIPVSNDYIEKAISNLGTATDTLPNGSIGQILTIEIGTVTGSGTWKITPTTSSGWASMTFSQQGQIASFLYVNNTIGWVILTYDGVTTVPTFVVK